MRLRQLALSIGERPFTVLGTYTCHAQAQIFTRGRTARNEGRLAPRPEAQRWYCLVCPLSLFIDFEIDFS